MAIIFLFFISYEIYSNVYDRNVIKTRVKTMESFVSSTEDNLARQLYISGFRIIFLAEDVISRTGAYLGNFTAFFNEAITNGTIFGNSSQILYGATLPDIQNSTNENARKMNLYFSLSNISVSASQSDPWNIVITLNAFLSMSDVSNLASWNKNETIKAYVPIEGFEDPMYLLNTAGKVSRKINQTIYQNFSSRSSLLNHLEKKYYIASSSAPSFIKRLEGINQPDENGIESFVYLPELSSQGLPVLDKSVVDYIYFSSSNPSSSSLSGMPFWFKLDSEHIIKYT